MAVGGLLGILVRTVSTRPRVEPEPHQDSVSAFARDLKDRLLAGRYRTVKAFAGDYALTGMSRSTVYAAIGGTRLPTAATTTKLLSTVAGADEAESQQWLVRRAALDGPPTDGSTPTPRRLVRLRDAVIAGVGLVAVTNGLTIVLSMAWANHPSPAPAAHPPCTPSADLRPYQVVAHVANTAGQGTYTRIAPQESCHTGFLPEADSVTVVCQELHGATITDVYAGHVRKWPVWDKLGSGAYVSDLYLDLPKGTEPALVARLPAC
jgi:predicted DNA-binding transcriptional regulator AlpA